MNSDIINHISEIPTVVQIICIIIILIIIELIISIFRISSNTDKTANELETIKKQQEYICQALNYIINNDGNFRADKPQYTQEPQPPKTRILDITPTKLVDLINKRTGRH